MKSSRFVISIAEYDHSACKISSHVLTSFGRKDALEKLNAFFREEMYEGHEVDGAVFGDLASASPRTLMSIDGTKEFAVTVTDTFAAGEE